MGDESPLPKQELLIKLLRMTTSDTDGEALAAIRRANSLLTSAGWDWEKLINGKIKVIEDPFKFSDGPPRHAVPDGPSRPMPVPPAPPRPPSPPPPPPPPRLKGSPTLPISTHPNRFAGFCHCCGIEVVANAGSIFKVAAAQTKFDVICATCNTSATIFNYPATPQRNKKKKSVVDLA